MNIDIRCPHEQGEVKQIDATCADYKPLWFGELKNLLEMASTAEWKQRAKIQVRLNQAIPGMACPRPIEGPVSEKMLRIGQLYVNTLKSNAKELPNLADQFWAILTAQPESEAE